MGCSSPEASEDSSLAYLVDGCESSSFEILGRSILSIALQNQENETPYDDLEGYSSSFHPNFNLFFQRFYGHSNWASPKVSPRSFLELDCHKGFA